MVATYADTDLVESAVRAARVKAQASAPSIRGELRSADTAIQKAGEALARYFDAFENGTLAGSTFAARVEAIEEKLAGLRTRREQLAETIDAEAFKCRPRLTSTPTSAMLRMRYRRTPAEFNQPGFPADRALEAIRQFIADHGRPPTAQS